MIAPLERKRVVFAGGGTGGHLYPALALARALPSVEPVFVVPPDRGDEDRIDGEFACVALSCPRADRARLLFPARLGVAVARARRLLKELDARAVVGLGGYASLPASLAARTLGVPLYLIECNAVPGRATQFLARYATGIGLGSAAARQRLVRRQGSRVTGTPLRDELNRPRDLEAFGLQPGRATLLVMGGSQGAQRLNERVLDGLGSCTDLDFQVLHCAGEADRERVRRGYEERRIPAVVLGFCTDIGRAYAAADLVLSRAGASTVAECLALGRPAVFVPYPWHRDRQQELNAREAARCGAARVVEQAELDGAALRRIVESLLLDENARTRMAAAAREIGRPAATRSMAAHLVESLGEAVAPRTPVQAIVEVGG